MTPAAGDSGDAPTGWSAALVAGGVFAPVGLVLLLGAIAPRLAGLLTAEEGPVEWLQVLYCVAAGMLALARARAAARAGRAPAFDLVVAAGLLALAVGEVELDRLVFGTKLVGTRFFFEPRRPVAWPWRALIAVIVVGIPAAIGVYALIHRRAMLGTARARLREPGGGVLLAGVLIFGATQAFEAALDRVTFVSPFFLEETAELAATACFLLAYAARPAPAPARAP